MVATALRGVIAAIATPIDANGAPDAAKFIALAKFLLANGCDGLNVLGTTGEATSFTVEERIGLMRAVAASGIDMGRLIVGTGTAAVGDAVKLSKAAEEFGFAGALVLPPFYYKNVPDAGIIDYFRPIVAATNIPLYLYNFPAMSGIAYSPALVSGLMSEFPGRIAGLKDSAGDLAYAREIAAISADLAVFPSNEAVLLDARNGDFAGCISATANLNADLCALAYHHGDAAALRQAVAIRALFDGKALVPGVKAVLAHIHRDTDMGVTKPPLVTASLAEGEALSAGYEAIRN